MPRSQLFLKSARLGGRVAIVTRSGRSIGRAVVNAYVEHGAAPNRSPDARPEP